MPAQRVMLGLLSHLSDGQLTLRFGSHIWNFGSNTDASLRAEMTIHHPRTWRRWLLGGSLGIAESYMDGDWDCDNLTTCTRIFLRNMPVLQQMEHGWGNISAWLARPYHWLRRNTFSGARKNISAHYDLGNEFFSEFLDPTMMYSCAIFASPNATLEEASTEKNDRLCRKLELSPSDHLLEIGTGWGGFALHAAQHYGCRITTTTISAQQFAFAADRIHRAKLGDRVQVINCDYRRLAGQYDKLVSIEMIEAVGHQYLDTYLACCSRLLKPDGMMALQAITINDQYDDDHVRSVDFIKRYIFPGSCLVSLSRMMQGLKRCTDFRLFHLEDITPHYVRTLLTWRDNFCTHLDRIRAMGFSERFVRMWEVYFCYCAGGFAERFIGDVQMLLTKPLCRRDALTPALTPPAAASARA